MSTLLQPRLLLPRSETIYRRASNWMPGQRTVGVGVVVWTLCAAGRAGCGGGCAANPEAGATGSHCHWISNRFSGRHHPGGHDLGRPSGIPGVAAGCV